MRNYNQIIFKGILGRDARVSDVGDKKVANFSVATEYTTKGKDGNYVVETTWLNVCAWQGYGVCSFDGLVKGAAVSGSGRLRERRYADQQGQERTVYEVVGSDLDVISPDNAAKNAREATSSPKVNNQYGSRDDIPF